MSQMLVLIHQLFSYQQHILINKFILDKYDSIINIYEKPVIDKIDDKSIYEFVENIENRKEISRKKYTLYKNNNFVLNHKEFNE